MSEEEKKIRLGYRKRRKKIITLQVVLVIVAVVAALIASVLAMLFNKTYYVNYTENSSVDYGVHLKENDFYEESFLGKDYAYIASLIDKVEANFDYGMAVQSEEDVRFTYKYRVDSVVEIRDRYTGKVLFAPEYNEIEEKIGYVTGKSVAFDQTVFVDYSRYNGIAESFIDTYSLQNANANLVLKLVVDVTGISEEFDGNASATTYVSSLNVPLRTDTVEIKITSAIPAEEQRILSYTTEDVAAIFKDIAIVSAIAAAILLLALWAYAYLSRNIDVTYDIKVAKLLRNYKSFIQKMRNSFDVTGYQVIALSEFNEMLEIRDTIGAPILMEENADKTLSRFFIPTSTNLLYLYEIKVEDYDEIYGNDMPPSPAPDDGGKEIDDFDEIDEDLTPVDEQVYTVTEESVEPEAVGPEAVEPEEAIVTVASEDVPAVIEEIEDDLIEETVEQTADDSDDEAESIAYLDEDGIKIRIACNRSFTANLIQSNEQIKSYYSAIKNRILSYKNVKARISWRHESYRRGRLSLFKMKIRGKTILLYCALEPSEFERSKHFHEEATAKIFKDVPMLVRVRSDRGLKRALGLVDKVMQRFSIPELKDPRDHDYAVEYPYETTQQLVERELIKLRYPGATAAEPQPHHHICKTVTVKHEDTVEEITLFDIEEVTDEQIEEVIEAPTLTLDEIDYDDASEVIEDFEETPEHHGVDVIGIVWPEKPKRNKIYRYDPAGETVHVGDVVIVPTRDASRKREVIRKAVVAHENHKISPESVTHPLKKIIGVLRKIK